MSTSPLVSVLMTAFNREKYIADAIESVLASSYENFELIIVDDASSDNTVAIASQFAEKDKRIRIYVNEKNVGDYPNRNKAAGYAQGKYINYVDADDKLYYYGLEVMVRFTELFPEAGFGLGAYPDDDRAFPVLLKPREIYLESFCKRNHFSRAPGSGLIKREVFNALGGFSGKRIIGDYEFWFKIARYHSMVKLPLDLYWNRIHEEQESQTAHHRKNATRLQNQVLKTNLNHPDCPLDQKELAFVKKKIMLDKLKNRVINIISGLGKLFTAV